MVVLRPRRLLRTIAHLRGLTSRTSRTLAECFQEPRASSSDATPVVLPSIAYRLQVTALAIWITQPGNVVEHFERCKGSRHRQCQPAWQL